MPIASIAATVSSFSPIRETVSTDYPAVNGTYESTQDDFAFDPVEEALEAFKRGEFVVVMDDDNRENEGDLICAASLVTTAKMAWFIKHTSGYICISMPGDRLEELALPLMVPNNEERHKTAYTITVDYKYGTATGISAHDRALTARKLASSTAVAADFNRPGHLCPLRAREGGVLTRRGHTEAGLGEPLVLELWPSFFTDRVSLPWSYLLRELQDLCRLTGLTPAALLCELVNDDEQGTMSRRDDCREFADEWGLKMISIAQLADLRRTMESNDETQTPLNGTKTHRSPNGKYINGSTH